MEFEPDALPLRYMNISNKNDASMKRLLSMSEVPYVLESACAKQMKQFLKKDKLLLGHMWYDVMIFHSMKKKKILSDYVGKLIRNLIGVYREKWEIEYDFSRMPFLVKTF